MKKHAQGFISFKKIKCARRNEITHSKKSKVPQNKPSPLHFSRWDEVPRRKGLSSTRTIQTIKKQKHEDFSTRQGRQREPQQISSKEIKAIRGEFQGEDDPQMLPQTRISIVKDNE